MIRERESNDYDEILKQVKELLKDMEGVRA
jgi:hypothetical protein